MQAALVFCMLQPYPPVQHEGGRCVCLSCAAVEHLLLALPCEAMPQSCTSVDRHVQSFSAHRLADKSYAEGAESSFMTLCRAQMQSRTQHPAHHS